LLVDVQRKKVNNKLGYLSKHPRVAKVDMDTFGREKEEVAGFLIPFWMCFICVYVWWATVRDPTSAKACRRQQVVEGRFGVIL